MALSYVTYAGDGATVNFTYDKGYISSNDISVYLDGVLQTYATDWNWFNTTTIQFTVAPGASVVVRIERDTDRVTRVIDFQDAANLTEADLDTSALQQFYIAQEAYDDFTDSALALATDNQYDAADKAIKNVPTPTADKHAANKKYVDDSVDAAVGFTETDADLLYARQDNNLSDLDNAATARTNLGLVIGTDVQAYDATILNDADIGVNVQAYDADLAAIAALAKTKGNLLVANGSAWVNLGVGTDGQTLEADSTQAAGVKWATPAAGGGGGGWTFLEEIDAATGTPTSITTSSIPGTATEILILGEGISHDNGASQRMTIIPDGVTTTANGASHNCNSANTNWNAYSGIVTHTHGASDTREQIFRLHKWDSRNWWSCDLHSAEGTAVNPHIGVGIIKLSGTLTTLTFDWTGTTNFDNGNFQIFYK